VSGQDPVSPTTVASAPQAMGRWPSWRLLFLALLALNVLLASAFLYRTWAWRHGPPDPVAGPIMRLLRDLPSDRRETLREPIAAVRQSLQDLRRGAGTARQDAASTLSKDPFDRVAFEAALRRMMEAEGSGRQNAIASLTNLADALTPVERQSFAKLLLDLHLRRGRGRN
jgi:uncharacterized membrane protein